IHVRDREIETQAMRSRCNYATGGRPKRVAQLFQSRTEAAAGVMLRLLRPERPRQPRALLLAAAAKGQQSQQGAAHARPKGQARPSGDVDGCWAEQPDFQ